MVEFALIAPIFFLLVFGMLEYGMVFRDYLTVANTTRSGARVASAGGKNVAADYQILQSVKSASAALPSSSIVRIVVFRSDATGVFNASCKAGTAVTNLAGTPGCNVYSAADMSLTQAQLTTTGKSNFWAPTTRKDTQSGTGSDYIGVYIKVDHPMITKLFGTTFSLTDNTIMRIEPNFA
jgi:Flp pilus assembly protein TadG